MKSYFKVFMMIVILLVCIFQTSCGPSLSARCVPEGAGTVTWPAGSYDTGVQLPVVATPAQGYRFSHWEGSAVGTSPTIQVTMGGYKKLVAHFIRTRSITTTISPANGGSVSGGGTYDEGQQVILNATPAEYYEFSGWSGAASGNSRQISITADSDKSIIANFQKQKFSLQLRASNGGAVQPSSGYYDALTKLNISATPDSGYRFAGWTGSETGNSNSMTITMNSDKNITANFIRQYRLSVTCQPPYGGEVSYDAIHDEGSVVSLKAIPYYPYYPKEWIGTDTTTNPATVIMNSDKVVTIVFGTAVAGNTQTVTGSLSRGVYKTNPSDSLTIQLKKHEWVQGEIVLGTNPPLAATIQDPNGIEIYNFKPSNQGSFSFMANTTGPYTVTFSTTSIFWSNYSFTYTIYRIP